jgi:hypothetical protein
MRWLIGAALLTAVSAAHAFGQETPDSVKYRVSPTADSDQGGIYVPRDLQDSFLELRRMLHPSFIAEFRSSEDQVIEHHFRLGWWMRNEWGLWAGSRLAKYFNGIGIHHPDDMSGIILTSFWRELNGLPIQIDEQIARYQEYWRRQGAPVAPRDTNQHRDRRPN